MPTRSDSVARRNQQPSSSNSDQATKDAGASTRPTTSPTPSSQQRTATTTDSARTHTSKPRADVEDAIGELVGLKIAANSARLIATQYPLDQVRYAAAMARGRVRTNPRAYVLSILDSPSCAAQTSDWLAEQQGKRLAEEQRRKEREANRERARQALGDAEFARREAEAERQMLRSVLQQMDEHARRELILEAISRAGDGRDQVLKARLTQHVRDGDDTITIACRPTFRKLVIDTLNCRMGGTRYVSEEHA